MSSRPTSVASLTARTTPEPNTGCWLWIGPISKDGYGKSTLNDRSVRAHRAMWMLTGRTIPVGTVVCHRCDQPSCINPDHLFVGTNRDNTQDMLRKGRNNPPRGERGGFSVLTESDVRSIRQSLARNGARGAAKELEARYRVSQATISDIRCNRTWTHIKEELP